MSLHDGFLLGSWFVDILSKRIQHCPNGNITRQSCIKKEIVSMFVLSRMCAKGLLTAGLI